MNTTANMYNIIGDFLLVSYYCRYKVSQSLPIWPHPPNEDWTLRYYKLSLYEWCGFTLAAKTRMKNEDKKEDPRNAGRQDIYSIWIKRSENMDLYYN